MLHLGKKLRYGDREGPPMFFGSIFFAVYSQLVPSAQASCTQSADPNRIVVIGDSHTAGQFGTRLSMRLKTAPELKGAPVYRYAIKGSYAAVWAAQTDTAINQLPTTERSDIFCYGEPPFKPHFPNFKMAISGVDKSNHNVSPKAVVIALGTNDLMGCKDDPKVRFNAIDNLLKQVPTPTTACVWISPTQMVKGPIWQKCGETGLSTFIGEIKKRATAKGCTFVDSQKFRVPNNLAQLSTASRIPENAGACEDPVKSVLHPNAGYHFEGALADYWADCAALSTIAALKPVYNPGANPAGTAVHPGGQ
jgi:hypothetical protein